MQALTKWGMKWNKINERNHAKCENVQELKIWKRDQAILLSLRKGAKKGIKITEKKQSKFENVPDCIQ